MKPLRLVDVGVNLADPVFRGLYRARQIHGDDRAQVVRRARAAGVEKMIVTGSTLADSRDALALVSEHDGLFATVGCHPTRCSEFAQDPDTYFGALLDLALEGKRKGKVVAIGECGLDYDRLSFCPQLTQLTYFERQFALAEQTGLPMFLHSRNTWNANGESDMLTLLRQNRERFSTGVIHSFDGSAEEVDDIVDLDLYIGINGCSLKTERNLEVVKRIPLSRLMIETDAPWCDIRPTHASFTHVSTTFSESELSIKDANNNSYSLRPKLVVAKYPFPDYFLPTVLASGNIKVKGNGKNTAHTNNTVSKPERWQEGLMVRGRNEPCRLLQVLSALASIRGESMAQIAQATTENAERVFGLN